MPKSTYLKLTWGRGAFPGGSRVKNLRASADVDSIPDGRKIPQAAEQPSPMLLLLLSCLSHVRLFMTPWTAAHQAPLCTGFCRQEYWSGLPFPSPTKPMRPNYSVCAPGPVLGSKRSLYNEKPTHHIQRAAPAHRNEKPRVATKTQHSQKETKLLLLFLNDLGLPWQSSG